MKILLSLLFIFSFVYEAKEYKEFSGKGSEKVEYEISSEAEAEKEKLQLDLIFIPDWKIATICKRVSSSYLNSFTALYKNNHFRLFKNLVYPNAPPFFV